MDRQAAAGRRLGQAALGRALQQLAGAERAGSLAKTVSSQDQVGRSPKTLSSLMPSSNALLSDALQQRSPL